MGKYSINSFRQNEFIRLFRVELFDQNGHSIKCVKYDEHQETHTPHELAVKLLADHIEKKASGFVKITGPGMRKVLYQRQSDFEPIEEELDQVYNVAFD